VAQTKEGAAKARIKMVSKYGSEEAYLKAMKERAARGGRNGNTGGFKANPELARVAGAIGGRISRRGKAKQ
jgi:uncharacterized protein